MIERNDKERRGKRESRKTTQIGRVGSEREEKEEGGSEGVRRGKGWERRGRRYSGIEIKAKLFH